MGQLYERVGSIFSVQVLSGGYRVSAADRNWFIKSSDNAESDASKFN